MLFPSIRIREMVIKQSFEEVEQMRGSRNCPESSKHDTDYNVRFPHKRLICASAYVLFESRSLFEQSKS